MELSKEEMLDILLEFLGCSIVPILIGILLYKDGFMSFFERLV